MNKKYLLLELLFFVHNAFGDSMRMDYCKKTTYYNTQSTKVAAYRLRLIKATVQSNDSIEVELLKSSFVPHPFRDISYSKSLTDLSAISAIPNQMSEANDDAIKLFIGIPYYNIYGKEVYYVSK